MGYLCFLFSGLTIRVLEILHSDFDKMILGVDLDRVAFFCERPRLAKLCEVMVSRDTCPTFSAMYLHFPLKVS